MGKPTMTDGNLPGTPRKRGRKSSASLSILPVDVAFCHPTPPASFSVEEKRIWQAVCAETRPGLFRASEHLLAIYVRALAIERRLSEVLKTVEPDSERYSNLVRLHNLQAKTCASLAGRLRLTPRSSIEPRAPRLSAVPTARRPWETHDGDDGAA
jgi:hypothetical protein